MNAEKWLEVKRIFNEAIELSGEQRSKFLEESCQGDAEVLSEVEKLIAADAESKTFSSVISTLNAENSLIDKTIGNYKIIREVGRGGMGAVFLATREDFEKQVALKIIKHEFSSTELRRRFQNERKILAALEHPNIARLLDGGATEKGLPYFVMEYVEGEDLLTYCETNNLSIAERLKIFRKICAAVSYAHGKLIVHRDLKPSNILVGRDGEPKLLDFGISKLLDDNSSEQPGTATALGMMTPNYASPEQIRGESVSTATDTYSLGVILYELLTNMLPYNIANRRLDEAMRAICETEPERPSSVVSGQWSVVGKETHENKGQRTKDKGQKTNAAALRGDLDNIILKALRKEPERRYTSIEKFSDDLRRHLEGLPVTARPDTFSYRAEKFIRRNVMAVAAVLLIILSLVGGVATTTYQSFRADRERKLAEKRFNQVRELANNVVFKYHDAIANLPGSTETRKMLVSDATNYLDNLAQDAGEDSNLQIELAQAYLKLADVQGRTYYSNIGDTSGAVESYRKAVVLLEKIANSSNANISFKAEDDLIKAYQSLGMMQTRIFEHEDSVATQKKALGLIEKKLSRAPEDAKLRYLQVRGNGRLADSLRESGKFEEAMQQYRKTLALDEKLLADAPDNEDAEAAIGVLNDRIGRNLTLRAADLLKINTPREETDKLIAEALPHLEKMREVFARLADRRPDNKKYKRDLSTALTNLGMALRNKGDLTKSLEILRQDLSHRNAVAAADPADRESQADLAEALMETAITLNEMGQSRQASDYFQRALNIFDILNKNDQANFEFLARRFETATSYGDALRKNGEFVEAIKIYQSAFENLKSNANLPNMAYLQYSEGVTNENLGDCYAQMAILSESQNNTDKIQSYYQSALANWEQASVQRGYLNRTPERIGFLKQKFENYGREISRR